MSFASTNSCVMNSLTQLNIYNESSSEKEEEEEEEGGGGGGGGKESFKERSPLPLPNFFRDTKNKGHPSLEINKEGKIRNFPHEPGNWATYLYVPLDLTEFFDYIDALFNFFKPLDLKLVDDFHISLTKTVVLRHHWIPEFISGIKKNLSQMASFKIYLSGLKAFTNEQKTRSFLSLKIQEGSDNLKSIVNRINNDLNDYNLPKFYEDPSFHVSLLWCSRENCSEINKYIDLLPLDLKNFGFFKDVTHCSCTSGNKLFTFNFY